MYSSQLLDHFQNPRNAGVLKDADAFIEAKNPACGDVLQLTLLIEYDRIVEIRFKAKGCVPVIACASSITELSKGKTLKQARAIEEKNLVEALDGLPQASFHAAQLAVQALRQALDLRAQARTDSGQ